VENPTELVRTSTEVSAFMPVMQMAQAVQRYNAVLQFTQEIMKAGKDYGVIAGIDRPSLLKPGAEKLCSFFGLTPQFIVVKETEEWTGEEPFFYYWYKCQLWRGQYLIAEGDGSCNSRESKYRYRWVNEDQIPSHLDKKLLTARGGRISEFDFSIDRSETVGKYGKPPAYWNAFKDAIEAGTATRVQKKMKDGKRPGWEIDSTVYRVPNPDVADQVNTVQKMAQKRALIAATLIACNASEYYTQDMEDMEIINVTLLPVTGRVTQGAPDPPPPDSAPPPDDAPLPDEPPPAGNWAQGKAAAESMAKQKIAELKAQQQKPTLIKPEETAPEMLEANRKKMLEQFDIMQTKLGSREFFRILQEHQFDLPGDIKSIDTARVIFKEMQEAFADSSAEPLGVSTKDLPGGAA